MAFLPFNTTWVSISNCTSSEWKEIGERLAVLPNLKNLYMENCNSADEITLSLSQSTSIQDLAMSNSRTI